MKRIQRNWSLPFEGYGQWNHGETTDELPVENEHEDVHPLVVHSLGE